MVSPRLLLVGFMSLMIAVMGILVIGASVPFILLGIGVFVFAYFMDSFFRPEGSLLTFAEAIAVMAVAFYTKNVDYTALTAIAFALGITIGRVPL